MDVDGGNLYVSSRLGLALSTDGAHAFQWSFPWRWDATTDVDFQQGVGWLTVANWGGRSGIWRKLPGGDWEIASPTPYWGNGTRVVVDPVDPANVAYVVASYYNTPYRTLDGGATWLPCAYEVRWAYVANGLPIALGLDHLTRSRGEKWWPLGKTIQAATPVNARGRLVVGGNPTGVFVGVPPKWTPCGLPQQAVVSLATCGNTVFALSSTGAIFRAPISALVTAIGGDALMQ